MGTAEQAGRSRHQDVLTVREVAAALRTSRSSVYRWVDTGRLPAVRVGPGSLRILRRDLAAFIQPTEETP